MQLRYSWEPYTSFGQLLHFDQHSFVYLQEEEGKGFYYLEEGLIMNSIISPDGTEHSVNYITEGMLFGEPGIFHKAYIANGRVMRPSTVYYFSDRAFKEICRLFPDAKVTFMKSLLFKLRTLAEIVVFNNATVEQKIAHFTIKLEDEIGKEIPFTQTSFAKFLGLSRKSVNEVINKWKRDEIVDVLKYKLKIIDINRLKQIRTSNVDLGYNADYLLALHKEFINLPS
ncbi:MAG TPA: Crp/Fnr family transcriptional regulator [Pseudogracilibacillus sp.]|nr:Crp/Fnr family transcriptional regulator [Pseudogracilibacillus sp.]